MARMLFSVQEAVEQMLDSDADSESGAESFFTDEEVDYMERLDPAEDGNAEERMPTPVSSPTLLTSSQPSSAASAPTTSSSERPSASHLSPSSTSLLTSPTTSTPRGRKISRGRSRSRSRSRSGQHSRSPSHPES
ncbi:piggyBac transposable element-derived protein 4-like [Lates japonicus]